MELVTIWYYASMILPGLMLLALLLGGLFNLIRGSHRGGYGFAVIQLAGGLLAAVGAVYMHFFPYLVPADDATAFTGHMLASTSAFGLGLLVFSVGFLIDSARNLNASAREVEPDLD